MDRLMIQGDIYWVTFNKPDKRRPVLILTRTSAIRELNAVVVASITSTIREIESQVLFDIEDGMPETCVVNLDNIQTVAKTRLEGYITHLPSGKMVEVFEAINFAFGIEK